MRRGQATNRELGLASALLIVLAIYVYLSAPRIQTPEPQFKEICKFQGNFSCYSVFLRRNSSRLDISLIQNTGTTINITSLVCTNKTGAPAVMPLLNNTILITSGERAYVSGGNSGNEVLCTGEDGKSIPAASLKDIYSGRIYVTYIEMNTKEIKFVNGTLLAEYS